MKQVVQSLSGGPVRVIDVPRPHVSATEVLVQTLASLISPGTERAMTQAARAPTLFKARARPDLVKQVIEKARTDGVASTFEAVRARLNSDVPLGYSAAGRVVQVGEAVAGIRPGQFVATGGAGKANHAEFQAVPGLLCAPIPDNVSVEDAAFATVASIALHGLRLADVGPGSKVVVIGLGLIGQLSARLANAAGCDVAGIDLTDYAVGRVKNDGVLALRDKGPETTATVLNWTRGRGADAVLVTAASKSSGPVMRAPELCRVRAPVVVVGDVGLDLSRPPFYEKELSLRFARSYGPGRYERSYEDWAVDYPPEYVRWTEGRNIEAVLDMISGGRLKVADLVTHRFAVDAADEAYEVLERKPEPFTAIMLTYPDSVTPDRSPRVSRAKPPNGFGVGFIGAGSFARKVLLPSMRQAGFHRLVAVTSASGLSAQGLACSGKFEKSVSGAEAIIHDPDVGIVVIATTHESHAELAERALLAGNHVFCEKPLALSLDDLDRVREAWEASGAALFIGFNRRWSRGVAIARHHLGGTTGPLVITYRVNAGTVPAGHWYHDRRQGGRLIGEVCHFVDTAAALVGTAPHDVFAQTSSDGLDPRSDFVVTCSFPDGSMATITYATGGPPSLEKERIDVLGRGKSVHIRDFRRVFLDGSRRGIRCEDKGHAAQAVAFMAACTGEPSPTMEMLASMRATLAAATTLQRRG